MLTEAHVGILFRAAAFVGLRRAEPDNVKAQFPLAAPKRSDGGQFKAVETYGELMRLVKAAMG